MTATGSPAFDLVADSLDRLGLHLPGPMAEARAVLAAARLRRPSPLGALLAVVDTATADALVERIDAAALALARDRAREELLADLVPRIERRVARTPLAVADELVDLVRPAFDDAAARLAGLAPLLPPGPTPATVLAAGPAAAAAWAELPPPLAVLDDVARLRVVLHDLGHRIGDHAPVLLFTRPAGPDQVDAAVRIYRPELPGSRWLALAQAGVPLWLPTLTEQAEHAVVLAGLERLRAAQRPDETALYGRPWDRIVRLGGLPPVGQEVP